MTIAFTIAEFGVISATTAILWRKR